MRADDNYVDQASDLQERAGAAVLTSCSFSRDSRFKGGSVLLITRLVLAKNQRMAVQA